MRKIIIYTLMVMLLGACCTKAKNDRPYHEVKSYIFLVTDTYPKDTLKYKDKLNYVRDLFVKFRIINDSQDTLFIPSYGFFNEYESGFYLLGDGKAIRLGSMLNGPKYNGDYKIGAGDTIYTGVHISGYYLRELNISKCKSPVSILKELRIIYIADEKEKKSSVYPIPNITVLLSNKIKYSYDEGFFINGGTAEWAY